MQKLSSESRFLEAWDIARVDYFIHDSLDMQNSKIHNKTKETKKVACFELRGLTLVYTIFKFRKKMQS